MKTTSLWVIRLALTVQFASVLAVPALLASNEAPRATWMAEWVRPEVAERTIGVLKLRDGKLAFTEQIGQTDWEIDLADVKRVAVVNQGRAMAIQLVTGHEFVVSIMESNLTTMSPKRAVSTLDRALQLVATNSR